MEENVALDSKKQKQFVKSLKGLNKLMKKTKKPVTDGKSVKEVAKDEEKVENSGTKDGKIRKRKRKRMQRGLVYLSHIPHGFYEHQMTEYFKQFGVVTNARVIRSKKTGNSKGHAFVEFRDTAVAQVVAETMNNYLMGKRLIKAAYIPPNQQRLKAQRKNWNPQHNLGTKIKLGMKQSYNSIKNESQELKIATKLLSNLMATKKKLKESGIDYDFFTPVDIPEALDDKNLEKHDTSEDSKSYVGVKLKTEDKKESYDVKNKEMKAKKSEQTNESVESEQQNKKKRRKHKKKVGGQSTADNNTNIKSDVNIKNEDNTTLSKKPLVVKNKKKNVALTVANETQQAQKEKRLIDAGVKPPENFIKIVDGSGEDSDSSYNFDSDEYDKMLKNDAFESDISSEGNLDDIDNDGSDVSEKHVEIKSNKKFEQKMTEQLKKVKKPITQVVKQNLKQKKKKGDENAAVKPKKPKFEKQGKDKLKKRMIKVLDNKTKNKK